MLTGLMFLILAADFSAIHGGWAVTLGIPFSGFAQHSFWLVPVAALLACVLPRRAPAWLRVLSCDILVLALVVFPIVVFSLGSRGVSFSGEWPSGLQEQLHDELGFPVVLVGDSHGLHIYFPRSHDPALVRDALRRHGIQPNA